MSFGNLLARGPALALLRRTPRRHDGPHQPDQPGHHAIRDFAFPGVIAQFEAESAVDDTERDQNPTEPDVGCGPDVAFAGSLKDEMMDVTESGLEHEEGDDDETEDGVVFIDLVLCVSFELFLTNTTMQD